MFWKKIGNYNENWIVQQKTLQDEMSLWHGGLTVEIKVYVICIKSTFYWAQNFYFIIFNSFDINAANEQTSQE